MRRRVKFSRRSVGYVELIAVQNKMKINVKTGGAWVSCLEA
jgi:hypothetical protein